jgi:serine/threonine-protein kinase RsbT
MRRTYQVNFERDIVHIRSEAREIAREIGFDELDQARIVQAISELARNVIHHAEKGMVTLSEVEEEGRKGLKIRVQDLGPGIPNFKELMQGAGQAVGETSGLKSVDVLMDEMKQIPVDEGTCVEVVKWLRRAGAGQEQSVNPRQNS